MLMFGVALPGCAAGGSSNTGSASAALVFREHAAPGPGDPALSWNGSDALAAYRKSWDPLTAGSNFAMEADTLPPGELNTRFFAYGTLAAGQYGPNGGIRNLPAGAYQYQLLGLTSIFYGVIDNVQVGLFPALLGTFASVPQSPAARAQRLSSFGLDDLTLGAKYRFMIQNPETPRPSLAVAVFPTLPTAAWTGNEVPKGVLPPFSVIPEARGGSPALSGGLLLRKNVRPLRFSADVFYSYGFPNGATKFGDLVQERMAVEDILDDRDGMGLVMDFVGLQGLPFSIDGAPLTVGPRNFNFFGFQPSFEINPTPSLTLLAGVLFPVAGSRELVSFSPNVSLYWYWNRGNSPVAR